MTKEDDSYLSDKEKKQRLRQLVLDKLFSDPNRKVAQEQQSIRVEREIELPGKSRLTVRYVRSSTDETDYVEGFLFPDAHKFLPQLLSATRPNQAGVVLRIDGSLSLASGFPISDHFDNELEPIKGKRGKLLWRKPNTITFNVAYKAAKKILTLYIGQLPPSR